MATTSMLQVVQHLRRVVALQEGAGLTDGQLLGRFIEHRDDAAFASLVGRHGPMVLGVCQRILGNHQDSEDAFQATFLILVRKATTVQPRDMVANWLHGVAYQMALKVRATATRRRMRERQVVVMPEPKVEPSESWNDLRPLLDQELSHLPDKYRVPIVVCDLEGRTRQEAARQLGCPEGTVAGRLARARTMLAKRLTRHGLMLSGGSLATVLAANVASANVPTSLAVSTIEAATCMAAGQAAGGLVSAQVISHMEGVLKTMWFTKLKLVTTCLLTVALLGGGAASLRLLARAPATGMAEITPREDGTSTFAAADRKSQAGEDGDKDNGQKDNKDGKNKNEKDGKNKDDKNKNDNQEEKVPLDKLPKPVVEAVKKRFPEAKLVSAEKETDKGKTVFEVAIKNSGQNIEVTLTPEGTITEIEKQIQAKDLPKTVSEALEKKFPKATFKMIEEVIHVKEGKESLDYYEVLLVTAEKKKVEVSVTPEGKIAKEEKKGDEKEEKK